MYQKVKKDIIFLLRILHHIGKINYIQNKFNNLDELFESNEQTEFDAILIHLTQIGENTAKMNEEIKSLYDILKWQKIKDFRNLIVHEYVGINKDKVFDILRNEIPLLKSYTESIIKNEIVIHNIDVQIFKNLSNNPYYKFINFNEFINN